MTKNSYLRETWMIIKYEFMLSNLHVKINFLLCFNQVRTHKFFFRKFVKVNEKRSIVKY